MIIQELKNKLLATNCFLDNKYLDKYCELIINNLETQKEKYKTQYHHIIPRCYYKLIGLDVDNSRNNLVNLLYKDHILAHYYLCLCTEGKLKYKLSNAFFHLTYRTWKYENFDPLNVLNEYQNIYEEYKEAFSNDKDRLFKVSSYFKNRSEETAAITKNKQSLSRKKQWANMSLIERQLRAKNMSLAVLNMSEEWKTNKINKYKLTMSLKNNSEKNSLNIKKVKNRGLETFEDIVKRIPNDIFYDYYIIKNYKRDDLLKLFNIKVSIFHKLEKFYGISKFKERGSTEKDLKYLEDNLDSIIKYYIDEDNTVLDTCKKFKISKNSFEIFRKSHPILCKRRRK